MNIDFTDELDYESRPHRNMWQGVLLQAWDDIINDNEDKRIRYNALSWFFDDQFKQDREAVADMASWNIKSWQDRLTRSIMHRYMEDHITDGPQTPEDAADMWDRIFNRIEPEPSDEDLDRITEERDA
jgi:hypothetical protein